LINFLRLKVYCIYCRSKLKWYRIARVSILLYYVFSSIKPMVRRKT